MFLRWLVQGVFLNVPSYIMQPTDDRLTFMNTLIDR